MYHDTRSDQSEFGSCVIELTFRRTLQSWWLKREPVGIRLSATVAWFLNKKSGCRSSSRKVTDFQLPLCESSLQLNQEQFSNAMKCTFLRLVLGLPAHHGAWSKWPLLSRWLTQPSHAAFEWCKPSYLQAWQWWRFKWVAATAWRSSFGWSDADLLLASYVKHHTFLVFIQEKVQMHWTCISLFPVFWTNELAACREQRLGNQRESISLCPQSWFWSINQKGKTTRTSPWKCSPVGLSESLPVRFGRTFSIGRVNNWTVARVWKMKVRDSVIKGLNVWSFLFLVFSIIA